MTTPKSALAGRSTLDREADARAPRRDAAADGAGPWRRLTTLAAMISVWRDLPVGLRRRIARDATAAMPRAEGFAAVAPPPNGDAASLGSRPWDATPQG